MTDKDFVIIDVKNTQEKVYEGDTILVPKFDEEVGAKITLDRVLLSVKGSDVKIGKPTVDGASVEAEVVEHTKGEKVSKRTYKAKSRYRRNVGSRQDLTKIKINKIKF